MFAGFEVLDVPVPGAVIRARVGGPDGDQRPGLLLLHGYPQTSAMWAGLAEDLARKYRVVAADLRGYGGSRALEADFSFRAMAADQVALMGALGFSEFDVIAHDRGARTAHRMALDHPGAVRSVALIDILPTLDVWRVMDDWLALRYYHWAFLAQPGGLPERLIGGDPVGFLHGALAGLSGALEIFEPAALAEYEAAARRPEVVAAWCGDYRAAAGVDLEHDRADAGRVCDIPCTVLWGEKGVVAHHMDPVAAWRAWFPQAVGHGLDGGHFLVEECPEAAGAALWEHLRRA